MTDEILPQSQALSDELLKDFRTTVAEKDTNKDGRIDKADGANVNGQWFDVDAKQLQSQFAIAVDQVVRLFDRDHNGALEGQEATGLQEFRADLLANIPNPDAVLGEVYRAHLARGGNTPPITATEVMGEVNGVLRELRQAMIDQGIVGGQTATESPAPATGASSAALQR